MKDMIKRIILMFVGVALIALPTTAQTFGTQKLEQPNAAFQSTSTMMGSGSQYSANPTLNTDGTASYNGASVTAPSGPRRMKMDGFGDDESNPNDPTPLGDAVLPLLLLAGVYLSVRVFLNRKRALSR